MPVLGQQVTVQGH